MYFSQIGLGLMIPIVPVYILIYFYSWYSRSPMHVLLRIVLYWGLRFPMKMGLCGCISFEGTGTIGEFCTCTLGGVRICRSGGELIQ